MGTWDASKIRLARKNYVCLQDQRHMILSGDRYLSYAPGLRTRTPICLRCALTVRWVSGTLRYDCADVQRELADRNKHALPLPSTRLMTEHPGPRADER